MLSWEGISLFINFWFYETNCNSQFWYSMDVGDAFVTGNWVADGFTKSFHINSLVCISIMNVLISRLNYALRNWVLRVYIKIDSPVKKDHRFKPLVSFWLFLLSCSFIPVLFSHIWPFFKKWHSIFNGNLFS